VCPVRARDDRHARARIEETMRRYGVSIGALDDRVVALAADLEDAGFGRSPAEYRRLMHGVAAIVHCAADVNWTLPYESLRCANVLLTCNLLRFAASGVRKRFHFISSLAACYSTRARSPATEDAPAPDPAGIHLGYAQSKWVAERLVEDCRSRGLDAFLHRPSLILADAGSGIGNDDDIFAQLMRGVIALGHAPDLDWRLDACPVGYVARAIASVVRAPRQGLNVLHLRNPRPARWTEAVLWMSVRGYRVELEPFAAWIERAERASRDPAHVLHRLRGFLFARVQSESARTLAEIYADPRIAQVNAERSDALVARSGLECPRLSARMLERIFAAWVERKVLPESPLPRAHRRSAPALADRQIESRLQAHLQDSSIRITTSRRCDFGFEHSILGELAAWQAGGADAMHQRSISVPESGARPRTLEIVVKPTHSDAVVLSVAARVASLCSEALGAAFAAHAAATGLIGNARRELGVYAGATGALRALLPQCYGVIESGGGSALLLERVAERPAIDSGGRAQGWRAEEIVAALQAIASVHGEWLGREGDAHALLGALSPGPSPASGRGEVAALSAGPSPAGGRRVEATLSPGPSPARGRGEEESAQPLWLALSAHAQSRLQAWIGSEGARVQGALAAAASEWLSAHACHPRTLIHNDFNPRNCAWRADGSFCTFDWELAGFGLPQRDVVEMLCFVLPPDASPQDAQRLIECHRAMLQTAAGQSLDADEWRRGVALALADLGVRRLPMYLMADRFRPQPFLERVTRTWFALVRSWGCLQSSNTRAMSSASSDLPAS
jgi:thioester reductase-like protein